MPSNSDGVGYRRPPRHTQFKKGVSGNPSGRPKRTRSFKADLISELQEKITVVENGRERRVSKQKAFVKTLTAAAIKKDIRAVNALLACMRYFGVDSDEERTEEPNIDARDLKILENYLAREKQRQATPTKKTARSATKVKP